MDEQLAQNDYSSMLYLRLYQQNYEPSNHAFVYLDNHHQQQIIRDIQQHKEEVGKHWFRFKEKSTIKECLESALFMNR